MKCEPDLKLYSDSVRHLSDHHRDYFLKWYKMLELEFEDQKQFDAGDLVWYKTQTDLEASGWAVFNLRLVNKRNLAQSNLDDMNYEGEGFFPFEFQKKLVGIISIDP